MQICIKPGTPDDDNRTYLPESIYKTDIVVNENGNNSQPYSDVLQKFVSNVGNTEPDTWYEYVPKSYDGSGAVPLVIGLHGGLMTGWGHQVYTSWIQVAERDNVIVFFPDAHKQQIWSSERTEEDIAARANTNEPKDIQFPGQPVHEEDNPDIKLILKLIEIAKEKYNIDEGRVFLQGMSSGNLMAMTFVKYHGNMLAGVGGSGGPTLNLHLLYDKEWNIINQGGHLAVWQTRPELNGRPDWCRFDDLTIFKYNRLYWQIINELDTIPEISIIGEDNFAFYKGKKADLVYLDIKNRDHGQSFDEAMLMWDYLFSGVRREKDGRITYTRSNRERKGDSFGIAIALGSDKAFVHNKLVDIGKPVIQWQKLKYHGLNGDAIVRGEYFCVPLSFIAYAFEAKLVYEEDKITAVMHLKNGRRLQFARGNIGCVIDNEVRSMFCEALLRNDELYIPIGWFAGYVMNMHMSACDDVMYITDHFSILSRSMANVIKDIFTGDLFVKKLD